MQPGLESLLLFETPQQIWQRVFRTLKPRTPLPEIAIEFRRFANANSFIRLENGRLQARISDLFQGAAAPVQEALAYILIGKLYRRPIPNIYNHRYRLYLNRKDVRRQMHLVKQIRGKKFLSGPQGRHRDLDRVFDRLNFEHFGGLLGKPQLGWSRRPSRTMLGHFDPSHNAIVLSSLLDSPGVPELALEYVVFHEMLHLRYPVDHSGARRRVHTREFREAEKAFPRLKEAKELLKKL